MWYYNFQDVAAAEPEAVLALFLLSDVALVLGLGELLFSEGLLMWKSRFLASFLQSKWDLQLKNCTADQMNDRVPFPTWLY